ncbi:MAG: DUF5024 domain-containing protein [Muribaculaceae bacterium]|nr:DUF5024 domain-containing protein [Muribaculaceae bacterium]
MKHIRKIVVSVALMASCLSCLAHKNLDNVISKIETQKDVQYVACTERRNPTTKRVYKSSKAIVISNAKQIEQLIKAFKSDSKDAVLYEIVKNGNVYNIRFVDKQEERRYTLVLNSGYGNRGDALLTVEYYNSANAKAVKGTFSLTIPSTEIMLEIGGEVL